MSRLTAVLLVPAGFLIACGGSGRRQETATSVPRRDLTLSTRPSPAAQVASRIELAPEPVIRQERVNRRSERVPIQREPETPVASLAPAPAPEPAVAAEPAPVPAAEAPPPDPTGRELAPGSTVTVIPVSFPASNAGSAGDWSEVPAPRARGGAMIGGGHGGHCGGGRGRGPVSILR